MLYAIISEDVAESLSLRKTARPDHIARLERLRDQGRLILAGPLPAVDSEDPGEAGFSGSLVVAEFESLAAAREWADADPYVAAGVYAQVMVNRSRRFCPDFLQIPLASAGKCDYFGAIAAEVCLNFAP